MAFKVSDPFDPSFQAIVNQSTSLGSYNYGPAMPVFTNPSIPQYYASPRKAMKKTFPRPPPIRSGPFPDDEPHMLEVELFAEETPPRWSIKHFMSGVLKDIKEGTVKTTAKIIKNIEVRLSQEVKSKLDDWYNVLPNKSQTVVRLKSLTSDYSLWLCGGIYGQAYVHCITKTSDKKETFLDKPKEEKNNEIVLFSL